MVASISSINSHYGSVDQEYMMILMELRRLGISPSGDKTVDKAKLEQAKAELITKIKGKENESSNQPNMPQALDPVNNAEDSKRGEMEVQRLGAMSIAELNRLFFGI